MLKSSAAEHGDPVKTEDSEMSEPFDHHCIVDLDDAVPAPQAAVDTARRRPRRQCPHCFTNRSSILSRELNGCEDRALQALRRAHPEDYDDYLQRERDAAQAATDAAWEQHMTPQCDRVQRSTVSQDRTTR